MASRPFPMDQPAHAPDVRRARGEELEVSASAGRTWPVLARIADVSRSEPLVPVDPRTTQPSYRVDAAHHYAAAITQANAATTEYAPNLSPPLPKPSAAPPRRPGSHRPAASEDINTKRPLDNAPMPIKLTVGAWKKIEPHRELIRFAALATLIVVAGMSVVLSMGTQPEQVDAPHAATTAAATDPDLSTETSTQSVEAGHGLTPMTVPEDDTTSTTPTATGPLAPASQALVADESKPAPTATSTSGVAAAAGISAASEMATAQPVYPSTPYAEAKLPQLGEELPRVQTGEPAVAKLRGVVTETITR